MYNDDRFTTIKDLSNKRRLPLLGKIRLGIKKVSSKTGAEYPAEVDYFVCPDEVKKIYGDQPKELDVMLPMSQRGVVFPQAYRYYGSSRGLKCIGNGEQAMEWADDKKAMCEKECPCKLLEEKKCAKRAFLMVILPKVSMGGVYQITTGAFNSIVDINSGMDYIEALIGRLAMIPLRLRRMPLETHNNGQKQTHFTLKLEFNGTAEFINQLRDNNKRILMQEQAIALPAPKDENPEFDEGATIENISDEEKPNGKENGVPASVGNSTVSEPKTDGNAQQAHNGKETCAGIPAEAKSKALTGFEEVYKKMTPEQLTVEIKALLKKAGFTGRKNSNDVNFEVAMLNHYCPGVKTYREITKDVLVRILMELKEVDGDLDSILIPFE